MRETQKSARHSFSATFTTTVMKSALFVLAALATAAFANTAPTVVIQSAAMRPGTTLMDVVYRVNDPDDATVKTRALAFVDGARSFAKVIRPITFVEGTAAKLGDTIPANVDHTLTWDVATDWNVDLGQVKFEVLAMDGRGLLPFDWITIPAAGGNPALTISKNAPSNAQILSALFWQYASVVPELTLTNGSLFASSGDFVGVELANATTTNTYGPPYILQNMNLTSAATSEVNHAGSARAGLLDTNKWHATNRPYGGMPVLVSWGSNFGSYWVARDTIPIGVSDVIAVKASDEANLVLKSDGTVVRWGRNDAGQNTIPSGLSGVTAIADGGNHCLALKSNGTVVGWGRSDQGQTTPPAGLSGVTAIAAGALYSIALKSDGTVVGWGSNYYQETTIPVGLSGVSAITTGTYSSIALKNDGTVVAWGMNNNGEITIPPGLSGVTAISLGGGHCLALKNDGTVVAWGNNYGGQTTIPAGLNSVTAIAAGGGYSLALKSDGTVVAWGSFANGGPTMPAGLSRVTAISAGSSHNIVLKTNAP